ncbi:MAG: SIR2 family protein [Gammaproteobacteria bacterium]|nr:SIR2 family protein [Gammaproteobacteria bacterium]
MTTNDDLSVLNEKPFSTAVEKFEKLLIQTDRAFLIGAGCSKCAGLPLTHRLTEISTESDKLDKSSKEILSDIKGLFGNGKDAQIEDFLSELVDMLAIAERRVEREASQKKVLIGGKLYSAKQLRTAAHQIKQSISKAFEGDVGVKTHRAFVRAVHRPVRVGKAVPRPIVDYLVLNYDKLIEDALGLERIPYSDGIDGGVTGWWSPDTFDRDNLEARVFKLHGSVDWYEAAKDSCPRRIAPNLKLEEMQDKRILIWPASTKYREAQLDPFAQLAERARRVIRPSPGSQRVLVICGYSFRDAHINIEIDKALRDSVGNLTVIVFSSEDEPVGQLKGWNEAVEIRDQVLIFAKRGFFHGDESNCSAQDLPWWKFENFVRLLGGER